MKIKKMNNEIRKLKCIIMLFATIVFLVHCNTSNSSNSDYESEVTTLVRNLYAWHEANNNFTYLRYCVKKQAF